MAKARTKPAARKKATPREELPPADPAFRVVRSLDGVVLGGGLDVNLATQVMCAFFIREAVKMEVKDSTDVVQAVIGEAAETPPLVTPLLLYATVDDQAPQERTVDFTIHGVYKQVEVDFADGSVETRESTTPHPEDLSIRHVYQSPGSYRVVATEGARAAECWVSFVPPTPPPPPAPLSETEEALRPPPDLQQPSPGQQ